MAEQLIYDTIQTTEKIAEFIFEYPVEQEFLLADYDKTVFKILKTVIQHNITGKYINGNKLMIEGYFRILVWYQPPAGDKLTAIVKKIPFQKQIDIACDTDRPYFIRVSGDSRYVNSRAINPSRIDIRSTYNFSISVYSMREKQVSTAVNSNTVCTDCIETGYFSIINTVIKSFSVENDITFSSKPAKIIDIAASNNNMSVTVYKDKVRVKGEIRADIVYTDEDTGELRTETRNFPYIQMADAAGAAENNTAFAEIDVTNCTVSQNTETNSLRMIISAQMDVKIFRKSAVIILRDAFSKEYEFSKESGVLNTDENLLSVSKNISVTLEDTIPQGFLPVYSFAKVSQPAIRTGEDGNGMLSTVNVFVIARNSRGEYESFSKVVDAVYLNKNEINPSDEYIVSAQVVECAAYVSEDVLKAKVTLELSGFIICRKDLRTVTSFSEHTDKIAHKDMDVLVLYYGNKGERIFDIAQRYSTDISVIRAENSIDADVLSEDTMLFVPLMGM